MTVYDYSRASSKWLARTCRLLNESKWPLDQPLAFNGSDFAEPTRKDACHLFFAAVLQNGNVSSLSLRNINLDGESRSRLQEIISSTLQLRKLSLCNVSCDECSPRLLHEELFENTNEIQELTLEKCIIDSRVSLALKECIRRKPLRSLTFINMDANGDIVELLDGIAHGDCSLTHFEVRNSRADEKFLSTLFQSLAKNKSIEHLTLDECCIGPRDAPRIADFLRDNRTVSSFNLSNNDLDGRSIETITERGLKDNERLRKLMLSQNPIGDTGAKSLSKLLSSNSTIESLSLVDCEIWGPGCLAMAQGLTQMKGLKQLIVDGEWEDHVDTILESMESNFTLQHLWTTRSPILIRKDEKWKKVEFYLRLNRAKRRMLMDPSVPASLWPQALEAGSGDASMIFHMLRHQPDVVTSI